MEEIRVGDSEEMEVVATVAGDACAVSNSGGWVMEGAFERYVSVECIGLSVIVVIDEGPTSFQVSLMGRASVEGMPLSS